MRFIHGVVMAASLTYGVAAAGSQTRAVNLVTVPIEGLTYCCELPGKPTGALIDAVQGAMTSAGVTYSIQLMPWARAVHLAKMEPNTCVIGLRKTEENDRDFQWAGPLMRGTVRILARKGASFHVSNEEHLTGRSIGVLRGSAYVARLERAGARVEQADTAGNNLSKLIAGRIDLMATSSKSVPDAAHEQSPIVELFNLEVGDSFVACHRALDRRVVDRLNDAIFQMRSAGALRQFGL
jgi:polar amino acid transport system substrate-binding protein